MIRFFPHLVYYETSLIFFLILKVPLKHIPAEYPGSIGDGVFFFSATSRDEVTIDDTWNPPKNYYSRLKCRVCSISFNISIFIGILYGHPNPPFIFADSHAS
jgi:hypothetical protein